ncbi:hypothetical protein C0J08_16475 [Marinomonas sp. CT5]|uniref:hypothetical protein n=1 Tax=Marinomonas sp. CT5 TaxID=2066133 RepID=UPI0018407D56|nr:hypothetical protein [Marinomonas sp. CT5]NVK73945.1 hypothetical protein [Oceanospirillaceae bacterium]QUX96897.1 hypothetical protein C0J08_16475 [Marinomonas sp. CT5]
MYEEASNSTILMLLNTAVYPFIAALIVSFIAGKLTRASSYLGYLGGFIVGLGLIHSGLSFPPKQAIDNYTVSALIGIISILLLTLVKQSLPKNALKIVLFGFSFYFLLNPVLRHSGAIISLSWAIVSALIVMLYLFLSEQSLIQKMDSNKQRSLSPHLLIIGLMVVAGSAAPVISIGGSLLIGQLLGAFGAATFGYLIIGYITNKTVNYATIPAILILGGLITQSHVLADIPLKVMLMITASIFLTPIAILLKGKTSNKQSIVIILSQIVVSALVSGLSLWLVWPESSLY